MVGAVERHLAAAVGRHADLLRGGLAQQPGAVPVDDAVGRRHHDRRRPRLPARLVRARRPLSGNPPVGFYAVGNAVHACAMAGLFAPAMTVSGERTGSTLNAVLATPANRAVMFAGRLVPAHRPGRDHRGDARVRHGPRRRRRPRGPGATPGRGGRDRDVVRRVRPRHRRDRAPHPRRPAAREPGPLPDVAAVRREPPAATSPGPAATAGRCRSRTASRPPAGPLTAPVGPPAAGDRDAEGRGLPVDRRRPAPPDRAPEPRHATLDRCDDLGRP